MYDQPKFNSQSWLGTFRDRQVTKSVGRGFVSSGWRKEGTNGRAAEGLWEAARMESAKACSRQFSSSRQFSQNRSLRRRVHRAGAPGRNLLSASRFRRAEVLPTQARQL
ncbi:hypothetical protein E2320_006759 [Naja naja]|nr:hypothetical protein E2320_006759 [Naja naja]